MSVNKNQKFNQSELPNIPGYRVSVDTRDRFHKSHLFDVSNGIPVTDIKHLPASTHTSLDNNCGNVHGKKPEDLENKVISKQQTDTDEQQNKENQALRASSNIPMKKLPRWVVFDRKVLRFYSFFTENVFNSPIEKVRIRKCVIYYFLEDDTISIGEIKQENSGIPQSTFLKRQRVPKSKTEWVHYKDLQVGKQVAIYDRQFNIIDADESTRKYFQEQNAPLAKAEDYPKDDYVKHFEKRAQQTESSLKADNDVKSYVEAILGRVSSERLAASKKYLANDGKVLRFWGVWDDPAMFGTKRRYLIHYFLADDSIEVIEKHGKNSGCDESPALLKRSKLPKKYVPSGCLVGNKANAKDSEFYTHADLRIGGYINIYGRQVLLCKCDGFTRSFYEKVHGLSAKDFQEIEQTEPAKREPKKEVPPYNGFGTEEDSLGSWHSLVPKPPAKNHQKLEKYDGCVLRFLAKLNEQHTCIENYQRRFIIEFYLQDDTILIYEKAIRNSGFLGGKFLERKKCINKKMGENTWFHAEDFFVGAKLNINGFEFDVVEADKARDALMKDSKHIGAFTRLKPEEIMRAIADKLWDRSSNQTQTFLQLDQDKDRLISPQELKALCTRYNWNMNPNQLAAVFSYFDTDNNGTIEADEFFKALRKYKWDANISPNSQSQATNSKNTNSQNQ